MVHKDFVAYKGFEIPKNTSKLARKALRKLKKRGILVLAYDDEPSTKVKDELVFIATSEGIRFFEKDHEVVLIEKGYYERRTYKIRNKSEE